MKRGTPAEPATEYARIEDIPGLPKYTDAEARPAAPDARGKAAAARPSSSPPPHPARRRGANAVPFADLNSRPLIAIVIDDVGIDRPHSKRAWELPGPLTLSFLPYAKDLREQARAARRTGQELMLHLPMEPTGRADPGPECAAGLAERRRDQGSGDDGARQLRRLCRGQQPHGQPLHRQPARHGDGAAASSRTRPDVPRFAHDAADSGRSARAGDGRALDVRATSSSTTTKRSTRCAASSRRPRPWRAARASWWRSAIRTRRPCRRSPNGCPALQAKGMALAPATAVLRKRNGWD